MAVFRGDDEPDVFSFRSYGLSNDRGYGLGGNDKLLGGRGNDVLCGGNQNDRLYGDDDNDRLYGQNGNDFLYGQDGKDLLSGGLNNDRLNGGRNDDRLHGNEGHDMLVGEDGRDPLYGGTGRDVLIGGRGQDYLIGGDGGSIDRYQIKDGHSNAVNGQSDVIFDWRVARDKIDMSIPGTIADYEETGGHDYVRSIALARAFTEDSGFEGTYAFIANGPTDTGYLVADLDGNGTYETGIILRGAGSAADFDWSNIV